MIFVYPNRMINTEEYTLNEQTHGRSLGPKEYKELLDKKLITSILEQDISRKLCCIEAEVIKNFKEEDQDQSKAIVKRRKKSVNINSGALKKLSQTQIDEDLDEIRKSLGTSLEKVRIEDRLLILKEETFKKNDRVTLIKKKKPEDAVISWVNSTEITFRKPNGEKFRCSIGDFSSGRITLIRAKKSEK